VTAPTELALPPELAELAAERSEQHGPVLHAPLAADWGALRFLAIGGGPVPENNEVSLERDLDLARRALPAPGLVLFAGGSQSPSVRELDARLRGDAVMLALGELFSPRQGRQSRYRLPRLRAEAATLENVETALTRAFAVKGDPLLVYIAAHGEQGAQANQNSVALWGGTALEVARLAELHEQHQRSLRVVITSCYSGGFAELAFAHADAKSHQPANVPRCGLFAGTWDRVTSGCDPNPDTRDQESYGLYFLRALAGTQKDGQTLPLSTFDYDRDGKLGLLDAHTWARIHAVSFDVPTTTSERWLRAVESGSAPIDKALLPEDTAVTERLGAALGLATERAALERGTALEQELHQLNHSIEEAEAELTARRAEQSAALLERWPVLDDPFHPDFSETFKQNRSAIETALSATVEAQASSTASGNAERLYERLATLEVEEARVTRLRRAYETLHRASALVRRGGPRAKYYRSLLACERGPL
jgi:hypothetical protein